MASFQSKLNVPELVKCSKEVKEEKTRPGISGERGTFLARRWRKKEREKEVNISSTGSRIVLLYTDGSFFICSKKAFFWGRTKTVGMAGLTPKPVKETGARQAISTRSPLTRQLTLDHLAVTRGRGEWVTKAAKEEGEAGRARRRNYHDLSVKTLVNITPISRGEIYQAASTIQEN